MLTKSFITRTYCIIEIYENTLLSCSAILADLRNRLNTRFFIDRQGVKRRLSRFESEPRKVD